MAPIYKKKQKRQLTVAIVCSVLVFLMLAATVTVGLLHRTSLSSKFKDEEFATAIAQAIGHSSRYDLKQSDLDRFEGLVYFWDVNVDTSNGTSGMTSYAYPVVMLCDKEYTDALIEQADPNYKAPEDEEAPDYSDHYTVVPYILTEPEDLNLFTNLRLLRAFDVAELNTMATGCQYTQIYSSLSASVTPISMDAVIAAGSLTKLTSLTQLSGLTKLEQLSLSYTGITNLEGIEQFPNLTKLDATYTALTELTGLDSATNLTYLGLNSINVTPAAATDDDKDETSGETSGDKDKDEDKEKEEEKEPTFNETGLSTDDMALIAKLPNLVYLDITNNNVSDLSALSALKDMKYLSIANNPVESFAGLENMKGLTMLYAPGCLVSDASAVKGFEDLEYVYLSGNKLTDLNAFSAATKVSYLDASGNKLTDASGVSGMKDLETLNLSDNKLTKAPDLSKLTKVSTVNLSKNELTDVSGLEKFDPTDYEIEEPKEDDKDKDKEPTPPTVTLDLSENKLTKVTLKASMVTSLNLSDNALTSLELEGCKSVSTLNISKNKDLETVPSLSKLSGLTTLTASETGLTELPALKGLEKLTTVNLSKSAIESIDGLKDNKSITTLTLTECEKLTDIKMLCTITALSNVNLSKCTALTDESIADAFGTPKTDDKDAKLTFPKDHKLTVNLSGCKGVEKFDIFDEYGEMDVTYDKKK